MDWFRYIDIYCERVVPGFWDEPLNALSNAAFLIAAGLAYVRNSRIPGAGQDVPLLLLTGLVAVIGLGSFAFHTFAVYWAMLADVIPISLFIFAYLGYALRRYFRLRLPATLAIVGAFAVFSFGLDAVVPAAILYGSTGYLPAVAALFCVGVALRLRDHPAAVAILVAGGLLAVSLTIRTIDLPLCEAWPTGTHFGWHVLNATLLYVLLRAAARHGAKG